MKPLHFALHLGLAAAAPTTALAAAPVALVPALVFATALAYRTIETARLDDAERNLALQRDALAIERARAAITPPTETKPLSPDTLHVLELMQRVGPRRADLVPVGARYRLPSGQLLTRTRYNAAVETLRSAHLLPT